MGSMRWANSGCSDGAGKVLKLVLYWGRPALAAHGFDRTLANGCKPVSGVWEQQASGRARLRDARALGSDATKVVSAQPLPGLSLHDLSGPIAAAVSGPLALWRKLFSLFGVDWRDWYCCALFSCSSSQASQSPLAWQNTVSRPSRLSWSRPPSSHPPRRSPKPSQLGKGSQLDSLADL